MSMSSLKPLPTLNGIFVEPKSNHRRNFLRENKLNLRDLQRLTIKKQISQQCEQDKQYSRSTKKCNLEKRRSLSQQRPDEKKHDALPRRLSQQSNEPIISGMRCLSCSAKVTPHNNIVRQSNIKACNKEIQTEDIQDEDFLYDALKKCTSNGIREQSANSKSETNLPSTHENDDTYNQEHEYNHKDEQELLHLQQREYKYDPCQYEHNQNYNYQEEQPGVGSSAQDSITRKSRIIQNCDNISVKQPLELQGSTIQDDLDDADSIKTILPERRSLRSNFSGQQVVDTKGGGDASLNRTKTSVYGGRVNNYLNKHNDINEDPLLSTRSKLSNESLKSAKSGDMPLDPDNISTQSQRSNQSNLTRKKANHKLGDRSDLRLPRYLEREKREQEEKLIKEMTRDPNCPMGHYQLPEAQRLSALSKAQSRFHLLITELNKMPMTSETLRLRNRKVEIEKELGCLENDIRTLSKVKVYVKREEYE